MKDLVVSKYSFFCFPTSVSRSVLFLFLITNISGSCFKVIMPREFCPEVLQ